MKKTKVTIHTARLLVFALLIGLLIPFGALDAQAAANKALSMKVSFNGKTSSDEVTDDDWNNNSYMMYAAYKKNVKVQKGMKASQTIYFPASVLKKDGDCINFSIFLNIDNTNGKVVGCLWGADAFTICRENGKVKLKRFNTIKGKEQKVGNLATLKKSGQYYVVSIKNLTFQSKIWPDSGKPVKVAKYNKKCNVAQAVSFTGLCRKTNSAVVYLDNLSLKSDSTYKISFDKKDYKDVWGWSQRKEKIWPASVTKIK